MFAFNYCIFFTLFINIMYLFSVSVCMYLWTLEGCGLGIGWISRNHQQDGVSLMQLRLEVFSCMALEDTSMAFISVQGNRRVAAFQL